MVLYYIKQFNETSQLRVIPTLYDSGLRFGDYDGIIEIDLSHSEVNRLNNMFFYRNKEYAVNAGNFRYGLNSQTTVSVPPPEHHTPCKDVATGLIEQMAHDLTGSIHDVASFENISELRSSIEEAIKGMLRGQRYKLEKQGTKVKPIDETNSIVHSLIEQFEKSKSHAHEGHTTSSEWKTFQFHEGDCLAFNMTFLSPGNLNKKTWNDVAKNKKGTNITYSVRLKFNECCHNNKGSVNSDVYDDYGK